MSRKGANAMGVPASAPAPLTVHPLTPGRMADLDAVLEARGCSVARGCYCMYYRVPGGKSWALQRERNRAALAQRAQRDPPPGLLGYRDGRPVGWVSFGPREDFVRLANSPTLRAVDDRRVWSIVCFVVPSAFRRQGMAHALLAAAVAFARDRGAKQVEGYPVDRDVPGAPSAAWFGSLSMFRKAGFAEVARRKPARPIVRLDLTMFDEDPP